MRSTTNLQPEDFFKKTDQHVHVPDRPGAGLLLRQLLLPELPPG